MIDGEEAARLWLRDGLGVSRETLAHLDEFAALLRRENSRQNLVSGSTLDQVWQRHIADSAQLLLHVSEPKAPWLDVGSGAGFPGLIAAALHQGPVTLVEPRKLRVAFLHQACGVLGIIPTIVPSKIQALPPQPFGIITGRAVAPLTELLSLAAPFSTENTRLIFPKGRNAQSELDAARNAWQGRFRIEPSLTDAEAGIVIVEGLRARRPGKRS
jgi:16S rRNA (guanine527-N7)-methyltransferase